MGNLSANKLVGLSLISGMIALTVSYALFPGGVFIETVDSLDIAGRVEAMTSAPTLAHVATLLNTLGMLLLLHGLWTILRAREDHSAGESLSRLGFLAIALFVICSVSSNGLVHIAVHLVDHGQVTGIPTQDLVPAAMTLMSAQSGLYVIAGQVGSLGFLALSLGIYRRFSGGFYKGSSLAMVVLSAIALIFLVIVAHNHGLVQLYKIANLYGIPMLIWVVMLGVGVLNGRSELTPVASGE